MTSAGIFVASAMVIGTMASQYAQFAIQNYQNLIELGNLYMGLFIPYSPLFGYRSTENNGN